MSVKLAYLSIIIIWSTTPLAVQWSSEPLPFFSVMIRMLIGLIGCGLLLAVSHSKLRFTRESLPILIVAGISVYLAMSLVYVSARYIPSGWISVLYGLSPIVTGICARYLLAERSLSIEKIIGMLFGLAGLALVFSSGLQLDEDSLLGVLLCLLAVLITGGSSVLLKKFNQQSPLNSMQTNIGGLIIAMPLFMATWLIAEYQLGRAPLTFSPSADVKFSSISIRAYACMLYLGLIATTLGFSLYYFLLKNMDATRVSMIALITPVTALLLGSWLNNEPVVTSVWLGTGLICGGLILFELNIRQSWQGIRKYLQWL